MMVYKDPLTYPCQECNYENTWTRAQVLQLGRRENFRDPDTGEDRYSLKCKNPAFNCPGRFIVALQRKE